MFGHYLYPQTRLRLQHLFCPIASRGGSLVFARAYVPPVSHRTSDYNTHSPQDVLDHLHPEKQSEVLASVIDGEFDIEADLGAASVNNMEIERRLMASVEFDKMFNHKVTNRHMD